MLDINGLAFFIGSMVVGVLGWWINRLYGQFDTLQDDHDNLRVRLSVAESRLDGVQASLEKIESRLEKIYHILTKE
jgi:hypothetical protein|tara:strand:+ start:289 stop:516 length:228 start_codon:yes stop_codon:yes gene_type:complete